MITQVVKQILRTFQTKMSKILIQNIIFCNLAQAISCIDKSCNSCSGGFLTNAHETWKDIFFLPPNSTSSCFAYIFFYI